MRIYAGMAKQFRFWRIISFWDSGETGIYSEWDNLKDALEAFDKVDATEKCGYMLVCFEARCVARKESTGGEG